MLRAMIFNELGSIIPIHFGASFQWNGKYYSNVLGSTIPMLLEIIFYALGYIIPMYRGASFQWIQEILFQFTGNCVSSVFRNTIPVNWGILLQCSVKYYSKCIVSGVQLYWNLSSSNVWESDSSTFEYVLLVSWEGIPMYWKLLALYIGK